jgi:hypothetical protein
MALSKAAQGLGGLLRGAAKYAPKEARLVPGELPNFADDAVNAIGSAPSKHGVIEAARQRAEDIALTFEGGGGLHSDAIKLAGQGKNIEAGAIQDLIESNAPGYREALAGHARALDLPEAFAKPKPSGLGGLRESVTFKSPIPEWASTAASTVAGATGSPTAFMTSQALGKINKWVPRVLNRSDQIASSLDTLSAGVLKNTGRAINAVFTGTGEQMLPHNIDEYEAHAKRVQDNAASPDALTAELERRLAPISDKHPQLSAQIQHRVHLSMQVLNAALPKSPFVPTAMPISYTPPLSARMNWMHLYNALNDFNTVVAHPTPETVKLAEQVYPEQIKYVRDIISAKLARAKSQDLNTRQAHRLSILLGYPVTPETTPAFRATLANVLASAEEQERQRPRPPANAKLAKEVTTRDAVKSQAALRDL